MTIDYRGTSEFLLISIRSIVVLWTADFSRTLTNQTCMRYSVNGIIVVSRNWLIGGDGRNLDADIIPRTKCDQTQCRKTMRVVRNESFGNARSLNLLGNQWNIFNYEGLQVATDKYMLLSGDHGGTMINHNTNHDVDSKSTSISDLIASSKWLPRGLQLMRLWQVCCKLRLEYFILSIMKSTSSISKNLLVFGLVFTNVSSS